MTALDLRQIRPARQPVPAWHARYHIDSHLTPAPWPHGRHRLPEPARGPAWRSIAWALVRDLCPRVVVGDVAALFTVASCLMMGAAALLGWVTP